MKTLVMCLALTMMSSAMTVAHAQTAAPAQPAAAPAAAVPPAEATPAATAAQPAPAAEPAAQPAPVAAPAEAGTAPDASADGTLTETERQKREADRARIRLLLARARAERAAIEAGNTGAAPSAPAPQREPEPVSYGDAGAAIAVGLSFDLPWHTDASYDLFSSNDIGNRYGLWATYDLLAFGEHAFLSAGAGFDVEQVDSNGLFSGVLDSELAALVLYGTAVVRYVPIDWLQPHARLSLGGQFVDTRLSFNGSRYDNEGDLPFGSLSAGFTFRSPSRLFESRRGDMASLSFGLMIEGGYTLAAPLEMSVDGSGPDDRDIALIESELDDLDRSGPFMRISLVARFL